MDLPSDTKCVGNGADLQPNWFLTRKANNKMRHEFYYDTNKNKIQGNGSLLEY